MVTSTCLGHPKENNNTLYSPAVSLPICFSDSFAFQRLRRVEYPPEGLFIDPKADGVTHKHLFWVLQGASGGKKQTYPLLALDQKGRKKKHIPFSLPFGSMEHARVATKNQGSFPPSFPALPKRRSPRKPTVFRNGASSVRTRQAPRAMGGQAEWRVFRVYSFSKVVGHLKTKSRRKVGRLPTLVVLSRLPGDICLPGVIIDLNGTGKRRTKSTQRGCSDAATTAYLSQRPPGDVRVCISRLYFPCTWSK